jgi:hypothetical protein
MSSIRDILARNGMSAADISLLEDVSVHAVTEAYRKMCDITDGLPHHLQVHGLVIACHLMQQHLDKTGKEAMELVVKHFGGEL